MAITVTPTINLATGEYGEPSVSISMDHGSNALISMENHQDPAFEPFERRSQLSDPAFQPGASTQEITNFWRGNRDLTNEEISTIQDQIIQLGEYSNQGRELAKYLDYRVTGRTDGLTEQDMELLGVQQPQPGDMTSDEIDMAILGQANEPSEEIANAVLASNIGKDPGATVVQHLAHQYFSGQLSAQEAYVKAYRSGVPHHQLYAAFNRLQRLFQ